MNVYYSAISAPTGSSRLLDMSIKTTMYTFRWHYLDNLEHELEHVSCTKELTEDERESLLQSSLPYLYSKDIPATLVHRYVRHVRGQ